MNFKQFLTERPFNPRAFSKVEKRLGSKALVGFEFEMWVSEDSPLFSIQSDTQPDNRDAMSISSLDDVGEIKEFFQVDRNFTRMVDNEFSSWLDRMKEEYVDRNWGQYFDQNVADDEGDDAAEREARSTAEDTFDSSDYTLKNFIDDEYRTMHRFLATNTSGPLHGWANDTGNDRATFFTSEGQAESAARGPVFSAVVQSAATTLGVNVREGNVKSADFASGTWVATEDGSIVSSDGETGIGVELVSPPLKLSTAIDACKKVFEWIDDQNIHTNRSTGLHINVSLPNIGDLDKLKLVLFTGDRYVLSQFNRLGNSFTVSQINKILNAIELNGPAPKELQQMRALASAAISDEKYTSINFRHLDDGYIEFRVAGGDNYHRRFEEVRDAIMRFTSALEIACDPELERQSYIKKLTKLLGKAERMTAPADVSQRSFEELLKMFGTAAVVDAYELLERYIRLLKSGRVKNDEETKDVVAEHFLGMLQSSEQLLRNHPLTPKQLIQLRILIRQAGLTVPELDAYLQKSSKADYPHLQTLMASLRK